MSGYIKTMKDLEAATYGYGGNTGNALLKAGGVVGGFGTPHDTASNPFTAAAGLGDLYNVLYGQKVWSMLNQEVNPLAMLAKRPYTSSGWRVLKSRPIGGSGSEFATGANAVTAGISSANAATPRADTIGGVPENAVLGTDFVALAPEYTKLYVSPKTIAHLFEFSELGMELAAIDDGVGDIRAIVREDMGKLHAEVQSKMLVMPLEKYSENNTTGIEKNYTSLLKIVSSAAELAQMADDDVFYHNQTNNGTAAQLADATSIFGTERTVTVDTSGGSGNYTYTGVASFLDAEVDFGANYTSGGCRVLTLSLLNDMIRRIRQNGGNPKVILTGYDTIQKIADLLQSQERFMDRKEVVPTHNGVRGVKGQEVGFRVATYYDIPIIPAKDMPSTGKSTSNRLSDILILDTDHLWLSVMKPTQYFEDGITSGNPFGVGKLGNQGMYRTMGETCCSFFKGQGKITNLKSA
tara:strand:- start:1350 stop:2744 length:1395 start_codon:yes stop_codon:yes gene_type:complete